MKIQILYSSRNVITTAAENGYISVSHNTLDSSNVADFRKNKHKVQWNRAEILF
jgi:hypothetical protein